MSSLSTFSPAHFLKMYGWVVLIIISILTMMFYFQIFDSSLVECRFEGAFGCKDNSALVNETHISFFLEKQINSPVDQLSIDPAFISFDLTSRCSELFIHPLIDRFEEEISESNVLRDTSQIRVLIECMDGSFMRSNGLTIVASYSVEGSDTLQSFEGYILA
jgi:hypothetical protein